MRLNCNQIYGHIFQGLPEEYIEGQDRSWPLDFIQDNQKGEWERVERGLRQRVKASIYSSTLL